jgi:CRISPR-associated exonuclease Cas4
MKVIATHINYLHICHRKLWLFANGIQMEHTSDLVFEGKYTGENTYKQRNEKFKELELDGVKIDFYDHKDKIVHEIKKSDAHQDAHIAQVKYYLYVLQKNGIENATGILEYPKARKTIEVKFEKTDTALAQKWEKEVKYIIESDNVPEKLQKSKCKNCSYFDFCWINELPEDL